MRGTLAKLLIALCGTLATSVAVPAQVADLPQMGPPVSDERGAPPSGIELSDEGPAEREPETQVEARTPVPPPPAIRAPRFFDARVRRPRPDLAGRARVRFLTSPDFEPFTSLDDFNRPVGFHVDLVRGLCETLEIVPRCQIQVLPWGQLRGALARGDGEAIIAGLNVTAGLREELSFTEPFLRFPARFLALKGSARDAPAAGSRVGVVRGTAHEAMLASLFPELTRTAFDSSEEMQQALRDASVDVAFGDGAILAGWLASDDGSCCEFVGEPYFSEHYFGRGLTIATAGDDAELASAFDWALAEMEREGRLEEIYLRTFPVGFY